MKKLLMSLFLTMSCLSAHAFVLTCKMDLDQYEGHSWKSHTIIDCHNKKKNLDFVGVSKETGPGIRDIFYYSHKGNIPKIITITCPFMSAKKLESMEKGESFFVKGMVVDANALVGARVGVSFGKPGVCFVGGISALELLGEVAFESLELIKASN